MSTRLLLLALGIVFAGTADSAELPASGPRPRLTFGVLSDIHFREPGDENYFIKALEYFRDNGADGDHAYYRVFRNGRQIASTVATSCRVTDEKAAYSVVSVDRWGNVSR